MENIKLLKAADIDNPPRSFLKDGAEILSKPISEICSILISHGIFPKACNVSKL